MEVGVDKVDSRDKNKGKKKKQRERESEIKRGNSERTLQAGSGDEQAGPVPLAGTGQSTREQGPPHRGTMTPGHVQELGWLSRAQFQDF